MSNYEYKPFEYPYEMRDAIRGWYGFGYTYPDMGDIISTYGFGEDWDISNITDMTNMFASITFNPEIGLLNCNNWDVSHVTNMEGMFVNSSFDDPNLRLGNWDVSKVKNMEGMFIESNGYNSCLNIGNWNVEQVTNMYQMFMNSTFDVNISNWNINNVLNMEQMFQYSPFNQNISNWKIKPNAKTSAMFSDCSIFEKYKPGYKPPYLSYQPINKLTEDECCILLTKINPGEKYMICQQCNKSFSFIPITEWLSRRDTCPHCRQEWLVTNNVYLNQA